MWDGLFSLVAEIYLSIMIRSTYIAGLRLAWSFLCNLLGLSFPCPKCLHYRIVIITRARLAGSSVVLLADNLFQGKFVWVVNASSRKQSARSANGESG